VAALETEEEQFIPGSDDDGKEHDGGGVICAETSFMGLSSIKASSQVEV
jgi:hypothetical protein